MGRPQHRQGGGPADDGPRGGVRRRKIGRSFVYTPTLSRESLRRLALKEFVDSFFDGSTDSLKDYLDATEAGIVEFPVEMFEAQMDTSLL